MTKRGKIHDHLNRRRKGFDSIQHSFMTKTQQIGYRRIAPQHNNSTYEKITANILLNSEKLKAFALISERRQKCPHAPRLFNIALKVRARGLGQDEEIKCIKTRKEEVKLPPFADDMIIYVENPKVSKTTVTTVTETVRTHK